VVELRITIESPGRVGGGGPFSVIQLGYEPNVISSLISVLSEISALHPSRFSP